MTASRSQSIAGGAPLSVESIGETSGFAEIRREWDELLRSSASDGIFLTWEWLYTWWKHLAGDGRLSIRAVRCAGELIALAPCLLRPASLSRLRLLPALEFLGSGFAGSDYLDVIVRRGREEEARRALASSLAGERLTLGWTQLRRGACQAAGVGAALAESGWTVVERKTSVCPFIPLAGLSWESYLATLGAEHRYNFHRKWKRLNRDFKVEFEQVRTPRQCRESIDMAVALHNERWRDRGGSDAFHTPGLVAFHREFGQVALDRGWLRLYALRLDGKPAAALYGFLYRRMFYFYQSGFDAAYGKHSVGLVAMGLAIQCAIAEGAVEYDLLHGSEAYKSHWSCDSRELGCLEMYPPRSLGWACRSRVELERSARGFARRMLSESVPS